MVWTGGDEGRRELPFGFPCSYSDWISWLIGSKSNQGPLWLESCHIYSKMNSYHKGSISHMYISIYIYTTLVITYFNIQPRSTAHGFYFATQDSCKGGYAQPDLLKCSRYSKVLMSRYSNWATKKNPLTFHYTGWIIGIFTMVYYNPHITG